MDDFNSSGHYRPFERLKDLLSQKGFSLAEMPAGTIRPADASVPDLCDERVAFQKAMLDVAPLKQNKFHAPQKKHPRKVLNRNKAADDTRRRLRELILSGRGFVVSQTPEYIEGAADHSHPALACRLHNGDFSIQDYVDLHGLHVREAKEVFEDFLKKSIMDGKKTVLVIHGRGLSSPGRPVLKSNLVQWMSKNPWRKWISAYTSARLCDGGAGATYILLRERPRRRRT